MGGWVGLHGRPIRINLSEVAARPRSRLTARVNPTIYGPATPLPMRRIAPYIVGLTLAVNTFQISARCRGAIHCALWDASTPQVGAMNCAPTPHLSSLRLFEMY